MSVSLLAYVVLQNLWFLVDFCTVLPCGILTKLITDSFSNCNVLSEGTLSELTANLEPFCSKDCSSSVSGLLDKLMNHFFLMMSGTGVFL